MLGACILILPLPIKLMVTARVAAKDPGETCFTTLGSYAFVAGTLVTAKPWDGLPKSLRGQMVTGGVILAGALIFWHWEAMIISYLAMRKVQLPFQSLEELVKGTDYNVREILNYPSF